MHIFFLWDTEIILITTILHIYDIIITLLCKYTLLIHILYKYSLTVFTYIYISHTYISCIWQFKCVLSVWSFLYHIIKKKFVYLLFKWETVVDILIKSGISFHSCTAKTKNEEKSDIQPVLSSLISFDSRE